MRTWPEMRCWCLGGPSHGTCIPPSRPRSLRLSGPPESLLSSTHIGRLLLTDILYWNTTILHSVQELNQTHLSSIVKCEHFERLYLRVLYKYTKVVFGKKWKCYKCVVFGCILLVKVSVTLETYCDHDKHALGDVEGMPPVMISNGAIVLPHSQKPATQDLRVQGHRDIS